MKISKNLMKELKNKYFPDLNEPKLAWCNIWLADNAPRQSYRRVHETMGKKIKPKLLIFGEQFYQKKPACQCMLNSVILNPLLEFIIQNHTVLEAEGLHEVHHPAYEDPKSLLLLKNALT